MNGEVKLDLDLGESDMACEGKGKREGEVGPLSQKEDLSGCGPGLDLSHRFMTFTFTCPLHRHCNRTRHAPSSALSSFRLSLLGGHPS